jgi:hypothetical protein
LKLSCCHRRLSSQIKIKAAIKRIFGHGAKLDLSLQS